MRENGVFNKIKNLISEVVFSQDENQILEENYATGIEYFNEWFKDFTNIDNYEKAEVYFLKALEVNPENYDVYPSLAMLYQSRWYRDYTKMEFYEKAERNYEKTRMCGIVNPILLCNYAVLYLARWENCGYEEIYFDKTESLLLKSLELVEYYDRPVKILGDMYKNKWMLDTSKNEYFDKAETYLEKAYEMEQNEYNDVKDATLCFNLGYIYQTKWNSTEGSDKQLGEKAEKMYLKSIELDPNAYVAMSNLGIIYENMWLQDKTNMENAEKAIEWYKKSFENDGSFTYGKKHLAKLYTIIWEYTGADYEFLKESEQLYLDIIEDNSDDVGIVLNFAVLNSVLWENDTSQMEYFDKAESLHIQVINLDNNYIGAIKNLERLNKIKLIENSASTSETEYSDRLIELATEVIESEDFKLEFVNQLGNSLKELWRLDRSKTKYYELSEKLLNKALKLYDKYESLDLLKDLYLTKWNENHDEIYFETIEQLYTDKLEQNSNDVTVLRGLGLIYEHRWFQITDDIQFFDKARECYEKCLEIDEHNAVCNDLGYLYSKRWEQTNDEEYFEKAEYYYLKGRGETELFSKMYLSDLYREKWRKDKTSLEYFEKSLECSERVAENTEYHSSAIVRIAELYEELLEDNRDNEEYFDKAINHLESLFKENDYIGQLAGRIAYMYHERYKEDKREDYETALNWYLTAFELDNSLIWIATNIGRVHYSMSKLEKNQKTSKEHYELSKKWYGTAIEMDTNNSQLYATLALAKILDFELDKDPLNDELFRRTEYLYKRVLEVDQNRTASWYLGALYRNRWVLDKTKNEFFDKSIEIYEGLAERYDDEALFVNNLGDLYMLRWELDKKNNVDDLERAKNLLYRTIELDNEYYYAYENLGIIYFSLWEEDKTNNEYRELSKQNYEKAYEIDVNNVFISKNLTIIKFYEYENISKDLETLEDASKYFEYSLKEKSYYSVEDEDAINEEYLKLAEKFFTNALKDYDNNVGSLTALGDVYAVGYANNPKSTKLFAKAEKFYKKSLKLKEDPEVIAKLSLLYVRQYKSDNFFLLPTANYAYLTKARRYYEKVMKLQPDNMEFKRKFDKLLESK